MAEGSESLAFASHVAAGAGLTLAVAVLSLVLGSAIGVVAAAARLSGRGLPGAVSLGYVTLIRCVPELLIILIVYFGGTLALAATFGPRFQISPLAAGVIALSIVFGGYAAEVFRSAWHAVKRGQFEAGNALGLNPLQVFIAITGPQMLRHALPSLGNLWLILLKETSLVSVVGLEEIMRRAHMASGATRDPLLFYGVAAVLYLAMSALSQLVVGQMHKRLTRGG
jgi:His/Glu/Gln/Arg/opine family amino acid ABC transporter permease subunit